MNTTLADKIIILGDAGLNYYLGEEAVYEKKAVSALPITILCVHGNHEERPQNIKTYELTENETGRFYYEPEYPNILFMIDGCTYNIEGKIFLCLGGAYSADKPLRFRYKLAWFESEQMSDEVMQNIRENSFGKTFDYIISHTCPLRHIPREKLIPGIDPKTVDKRTEQFFDECYDNIIFNKWFCGHWHINKTDGKIRFLHEDIIAV